MIVGLDSASAPTADQARAAAAAGIRLWNGYLQTRPSVGLYHNWAQAEFENARLCGGTPIAFCSGWDDPTSCRQLAALWNVRLCLDVEAGIRGDGPWVQQWLDASGAGLYGLASTHPGRRAAFHILAWYPGYDPRTTWSGPPTGVPCGWQWDNSHAEFGLTVDRGWYDDWFAQSEEKDMLYIVNTPSEGQWLLSGSLYCHIAAPADTQSMLNAGAKTFTVDESTHQAMVSGSRSAPNAGAPNYQGTVTLTPK